MADDPQRNFRSAYYEKVGFRGVEEKKSLEILSDTCSTMLCCQLVELLQPKGTCRPADQSQIKHPTGKIV